MPRNIPKNNKLYLHVLIAIIVLCTSIHITRSFEILIVVGPLSYASHIRHFNKIATILADAVTPEHNITILRNSVTVGNVAEAPASNHQRRHNIREITIRDTERELFERKAQSKEMFYLKWNRSDELEYYAVQEQRTEISCRSMLAARETWLQVAAHGFDLVIVHMLYSSCLMAASRHYLPTVPLVAYSQTMLMPGDAYNLYLPHPPSYITPVHRYLHADVYNKPNVYNRLVNVINYFAFNLYFFRWRVDLWPGQNAADLYLRNDDGTPAVPDVSEVAQDISLTFVHTDFVLESARPILPNMVHLGGILCKPAQPLPTDLEEIVSSDQCKSKGVILVSFGTLINSMWMDHGVLDHFLDTFAVLPHCVLFKLDIKVTWRVVAPNIYIRKWFPQQDLLGHPNVKVLISHGGINSAFEALYHAVPVLAIGLVGDQLSNTYYLENTGMAICLDRNNVNKEDIIKMIDQLVNNKSYAETATEISRVFRENASQAAHRLLHWVNYICRHKMAAKYLIVRAHSLNFVQYFNFDILVILFSIVVFIFHILCKFVYFLGYCCFHSRRKKVKVLKNCKIEGKIKRH